MPSRGSIVAFSLLLLAIAIHADHTGPLTYVVDWSAGYPSEGSLSVPVTATVRWIWGADVAHNVVSSSLGLFRSSVSPVLSGSFNLAASTLGPGTFTYFSEHNAAKTFTLRVTNVVTTTTPATTTTVPSTPPTPTINRVRPGDGRVLLSWSLPSAVSQYNYQVTIQPGGTVLYVRQAHQTMTDYLIDELVNDVSYTFTVRACGAMNDTTCVSPSGVSNTSVAALPMDRSAAHLHCRSLECNECLEDPNCGYCSGAGRITGCTLSRAFDTRRREECALHGGNWLEDAASASNCTTPVNCPAFSNETSCSSEAVCTWESHCELSGDHCASHSDLSDCEMTTGCFWSSIRQTCRSWNTPCRSASTSTECAAHAECSWLPFCNLKEVVATCTEILHRTFSVLRITSLENLDELSRHGCTTISGSLEITGVEATSADFHRALSRIKHINGYLKLTGNTNLTFWHLHGLQTIGASPLAQLYEGTNVLVASGNKNFVLAPVLEELFDNIPNGGVEIDESNEFLSCPNSSMFSKKWWKSSRMQLSLNLSTLPSCDCLMFSDDGLCKSQCEDCLQSCVGGSVNSATDLAVYSTGRKCQRIIGSLQIVKLPSSVTELDLLSAFGEVTEITGHLDVSFNPSIVSLEFLPKLVSVERINVHDNTRLMSARLPALVLAPELVVVTGHHQYLLTENLPLTNGSLAGTVDVEQQFLVAGSEGITADERAALETDMAAALGVPLSTLSTHALTRAATGMQLTVRVRHGLNGSLELAQNMTRIFTDSSFLPAIQAINGSACVSLDRVERVPVDPAVPTVDQPVVNVSFAIRDLGVSIMWQVQGLTMASPTFVVMYRPQPRLESVDQVEELLELAFPDRSEELQETNAEATYEFMAGWTTVEVDGSLDYLAIPMCGIHSGEACLDTLATYEVVVRAVEGDSEVTSMVTTLSMESIGLTVPRLASSSTNESITLTWLLPEPIGSNVLAGFYLYAAMDVTGNALRSVYDAEYAKNLGPYFDVPLQLTFQDTRFYLNASATSFTLSGCYYIPAEVFEQLQAEQILEEDSEGVIVSKNTTHCIRPWTLYRFVLVPFGTERVGVPFTALAATTSSAPGSVPRNVSGQAISANTLRITVLLPRLSNGIITALAINATSDAGHSVTLNETVTLSAEDQILDMGASVTFEVPGLRGYTEYEVAIAAMNEYGTGPAARIRLLTNAQVPAQPGVPDVSATDEDGFYLVTWDEPSPLPGPILYYQLVRDSTVVYEGTGREVLVRSPGDLQLRIATPVGVGALSGQTVAPAASASSADANVGFIMGGLAAACGVMLLILIGIFAARWRARIVQRRKDIKELSGWEFPRSNIFIEKQIGEGAFGVVFRAKATMPGSENSKMSMTVAIKQCGSKENAVPSENDKTAFLAEAKLLARFALAGHPNLILLVGVVTAEEPFMIMMEFAERGDLRSLLRDSRGDEYTPDKFTQAQLLKFCLDVSSGMAHLEEAKVVHRDLAARNCLVTKNLVVKISDYGLSRDVHYTDYYRKNGQALMPVRWMPPESLEQGYFTSKSDVWAYGVVCWEIFSFGSVPYGSMSNQEVFDRLVAREIILDQPEGCPDAVYKLMREMWDFDENKRPGFAFYRSNIQDILARLELGAEDTDLACSTLNSKPWRSKSFRVDKFDDSYVVENQQMDTSSSSGSSSGAGESSQSSARSAALKPLDGYTMLDPSTVNSPNVSRGPSRQGTVQGVRSASPATPRAKSPMAITRSHSSSDMNRPSNGKQKEKQGEKQRKQSQDSSLESGTLKSFIIAPQPELGGMSQDYMAMQSGRATPTTASAHGDYARMNAGKAAGYVNMVRGDGLSDSVLLPNDDLHDKLTQLAMDRNGAAGDYDNVNQLRAAHGSARGPRGAEPISDYDNIHRLQNADRMSITSEHFDPSREYLEVVSGAAAAPPVQPKQRPAANPSSTTTLRKKQGELESPRTATPTINVEPPEASSSSASYLDFTY